jgi:hypothetical protein
VLLDQFTIKRSHGQDKDKFRTSTRCYGVPKRGRAKINVPLDVAGSTLPAGGGSGARGLIRGCAIKLSILHCGIIRGRLTCESAFAGRTCMMTFLKASVGDDPADDFTVDGGAVMAMFVDHLSLSSCPPTRHHWEQLHPPNFRSNRAVMIGCSRYRFCDSVSVYLPVCERSRMYQHLVAATTANVAVSQSPFSPSLSSLWSISSQFFPSFDVPSSRDLRWLSLRPSDRMAK